MGGEEPMSPAGDDAAGPALSLSGSLERLRPVLPPVRPRFAEDMFGRKGELSYISNCRWGKGVVVAGAELQQCGGIRHTS